MPYRPGVLPRSHKAPRTAPEALAEFNRFYSTTHVGEVIAEVCGDEYRGEVGFDSKFVDHVTDRVTDRDRGLWMLRDGSREPRRHPSIMSEGSTPRGKSTSSD